MKERWRDNWSISFREWGTVEVWSRPSQSVEDTGVGLNVSYPFRVACVRLWICARLVDTAIILLPPLQGRMGSECVQERTKGSPEGGGLQCVQ